MGQYVEFEGELVVDAVRGLTRVWKYGFKNAPSLLRNYWNASLMPLRPPYECLDRLMHPEGVDKNFEEYAVRCMAFALSWAHNNFVKWKVCQRLYVLHKLACWERLPSLRSLKKMVSNKKRRSEVERLREWCWPCGEGGERLSCQDDGLWRLIVSNVESC
eukprot:Lankesteria_metandrocarpae@DN7657_c0_g1_i1.p1